MTRIKYILGNWKLVVHLLFRTKRFGVNNQWWSDFDGHFGLPLHKVILRTIMVYPIIYEYYCLKFRAVHNHFLSSNEKNKLGWDHKNTPGFFTLMAMRNTIVMFKRMVRKRNVKKFNHKDD